MTHDSDTTSSLIQRGRLQAISASGLGVLYVAALAALGHGLISPLGLAVACSPPLAAGLLIASARRWQGMALVALSGGLGALLVVSINGAPGPTISSGLVVLLLAANILYSRVRWRLPQVVTLGGAFALMILWQVQGLLSPLALLIALTVAWLTAVGSSFMERMAGEDRGAALLGLGGSGAALLTALLAAGWSANLAGLAGVLLSVQGVIHDQLPGRRQSTGQILLTAGLGLSAVGAYLWIGSLGLVFGLGALSIIFLLLGRRHESRALELAAFVSVGCQALVMGASHPALHQVAPQGWHIWSLASLVLALQLGWIWWSGSRGAAMMRQRPWIGEGLHLLQALYVVAALSTEITLLVRWVPAMTLLWTAAAVALWVLGRRSAGLRVSAVICIGAALLKLLIYDWALLDGGTRVALLMFVGTTMLVTPLFALEDEVKHPEEVAP